MQFDWKGPIVSIIMPRKLSVIPYFVTASDIINPDIYYTVNDEFIIYNC